VSLENVIFTNVPTAIQGPSSSVILAGTTGTLTIGGWVLGNVYSPVGPTKAVSPVTGFIRPAALTVGTSVNFYSRSKPQYENVLASGFASVRAAGAKGDGVTDDTAALQAIITSATAAGKIVYFDSGIYMINTSITIPPGARIVGEAYPVIMAYGRFFSDIGNAVPVVRVGLASGQTGVVEWSDMIVSTQGACAGAVLIQWNLASPAATPSGMCKYSIQVACLS
jgi:glucan 1,3-beta-glucosidase